MSLTQKAPGCEMGSYCGFYKYLYCRDKKASCPKHLQSLQRDLIQCCTSWEIWFILTIARNVCITLISSSFNFRYTRQGNVMVPLVC